MTDKFQLIEDIEFIHQKGILNQKYVLLGSATINSYIKMNESTYKYVKEIVSLLQKNNSQEEILKAIARLYPNQNIDISSFISKLKKAGLLVGYEKCFDDEMALLGIEILKKKFNKNTIKLQKKKTEYVYNFFSLAYIWCPLVSIAIFIFLFMSEHGLQHPTAPLNSFAFEIVIILFFTGLCFFFHELGHAIAAINNSINIKEFLFGAYLGFIPMFYFRYYNLKAATPRVKWKVVIAGIYVNAILALLTFSLSYLLSVLNMIIAFRFYQFAYLNMLMIIGNLLPTRLSDGYYIISLLASKYNIRLSFWRNMFFNSDKKRKPNLPLLLYSCAIVLSLVYTFVSLVSKVTNYIQSENYIYGYGIIIAICVVMFCVVINIKTKLYGVKSMFLNLIKQRLKIKKYKNHCFSIMLISMLLTTIIATGYVVFLNAENHALVTYWNKSGDADIITVSSPENEIIEAISNSANSTIVAYINEESCLLNQGKNEVGAVVAYTNTKKLNEKFKLGIENDEMDSAIINTTFMNNHAAEIGDIITINGSDYKISNTTNALNFLSQNEEIIIINTQNTAIRMNENSHNYIVSFFNLLHDGDTVNQTTQLLEKNGIEYINQYEGSTAITDEFDRLTDILFVLLFAVVIICSILFITSFSLALKNEAEYWTDLRLLGLSKSNMIWIKILENTIFSFAGNLLGIILGVFVAKLICIFTDTMFDYSVLNWKPLLTIWILVIFVTLISTLTVLWKTTTKNILTPLNRRQSSYTKHDYIKITITNIVIAMIFILLYLNIKHIEVFKSELIYLIFRLISSVFALIFGILAFTNGVLAYIIKSKKLLSFTLKNSVNRVKGIILTLALCIAMLGVITDFSDSFKLWATELADNQITFDARASANNDSIGLEQINSFKNTKNISLSGNYYLGIGKVANFPTYIITELPNSNMLADTYNTSVSCDTLTQNEILISEQLMENLSLKTGDEVNLNLDGNMEKVTILDSFKTQDYSACLIVVSNFLFATECYDMECVNFSLINPLTIEELKSSYDFSSITFETKEDLRNQWQESIVSGVNVLLALCIVISVILVLMLNNSIKNATMDRKHEFALLRIIGLGKGSMFKLLYLEIIILNIPALLISTIFIPIVSKAFIELNAIPNGYDITAHSNILFHLFILLLLIVILMISPIRLFNKFKNESPISSIKTI